MSRPRYRRSGNPGEPDAGRTQDHDKSAAPVVLPHVLVRVDDDGTLAVTVDGEPFEPEEFAPPWRRSGFGTLIDAVTGDRRVPVRVEVREVDGTAFTDIMARSESKPTFRPMPFNAPLYILFSSGTTGVPKCIVHGAGGTLIQHLKEHRYHADIRPGDRVFYFSTCGWMMWNWLVTALASDATLILYDGSPFAPSHRVLWDYAQEERITFFGTSAKYIDALKVNKIEFSLDRKFLHHNQRMIL